MRKELFGLLALALLALSSVKASRSFFYPVMAIILYILGCIGNILHCLMAPPMIAAFFLSFKAGQISERAFRITALIITVMSLIWIGVAVLFREIPDLAGICDPLLARGVRPNFCDAALRWLVTGEVDHAGQVAQRLTLSNLSEYAFIAVLCLVPVALSFSVFAQNRILWVFLGFSFVPMLPLYILATDWGRWISISYTIYVLLVLQANATGVLPIKKLPSNLYLGVFLVISVLISPEVSIGWVPGGAVFSLIEAASRFF